jgi:hypothetical protein
MKQTFDTAITSLPQSYIGFIAPASFIEAEKYGHMNKGPPTFSQAEVRHTTGITKLQADCYYKVCRIYAEHSFSRERDPNYTFYIQEGKEKQ